jgi:hypothetical protein
MTFRRRELLVLLALLALLALGLGLGGGRATEEVAPGARETTPPPLAACLLYT